MEIYSSKDNDQHSSHPNYDMETFSSPVQASHSYPYTTYETQELALARSQQYQRIVSQSGKTEAKPRLMREEVETLEREFQVNPKPNSSLKAKLADELGLDTPRISNWFQNRRAKEKQDKKIKDHKAPQAAAVRAASEFKSSEDHGDSSNAVSEFNNLSNHSQPLQPSSALYVNNDSPSDQQSQSPGTHDDGDNEDDNFATPDMSPIHRKENPRGLLYPRDKDRDSENKLQLNVSQIGSSSSTQLSRDVVKGEREPTLTTLVADEKQLRKQPLNCRKSHVVVYLLGCLSWMRKITRPRVKPEFRRIEWKCDCGANLYADFPSSDEHLDNLASSLQNPGQPSTNQVSNVPLKPPNASIPNSSGNTRQGGISNIGNPMKQGLVAATSSNVSSQVSIRQPRFLALCVNTGGIYKTLAEIDASGAISDAAVFFIMKNEYLKIRGLRSRFKFLIKPATIEFVQFTLWNRRGAYISVCNRPNSIPPDDSVDYEYSPKPLRPLLPMPPEIFIHYLDHGEGDLSPVRNDWFPRLPKRLNKRVIDCDEACFGWGVHIIEGPNREVIFWIAIFTILASVLTSVLWSTLKSDVQGGAGLGALIVALPPAILAAFLFRLGGI